MEKERRIKMLSMVALIIAVLGLSIAFAALSTSLTINGNAKVDSASWDIHFETVEDGVEITGDGSLEGTPTLSGTTISDFNASVTKPGDKVVYKFKIVNDGDIDAVINSYNDLTQYINIAKQNQDLDYDFNGDKNITGNDVVVYTSMIKAGLYYEDETTKIKKKDKLNAGEEKILKLIVEYNTSSNYLPEKPIKIYDNATATINYEQAD